MVDSLLILLIVRSSRLALGLARGDVCSASIGQDGCSDEELGRIVLAYEPVWAIGTGRSATPEQAQEIHAFLRSQIAERSDTLSRSLSIVYGGSVKPDNAETIFAGDDVDGALVGGASLKADSFADIARAMSSHGA